jgi:hypothetical protein
VVLWHRLVGVLALVHLRRLLLLLLLGVRLLCWLGDGCHACLGLLLQLLWLAAHGCLRSKRLLCSRLVLRLLLILQWQACRQGQLPARISSRLARHITLLDHNNHVLLLVLLVGRRRGQPRYVAVHACSLSTAVAMLL